MNETGVRVHEIAVRAVAGTLITIGWDLRADVRADLQDAATGVAMISAINAADVNAVWRPQNGNIGCYFGGDFNLNGVVNATDYVMYWRVNNGVIGQVP